MGIGWHGEHRRDSPRNAGTIPLIANAPPNSVLLRVFAHPSVGLIRSDASRCRLALALTPCLHPRNVYLLALRTAIQGTTDICID